MNTAWLFAGGAAAAGLLATAWRYLLCVYQYMMSWLIISITVNGYQSDAIQYYLRENFKASKFGPRLYTAWLLHVRPRRRTQLVTMEVIGSSGRLFWQSWRPMWVSKSGKGDDAPVESGVTSRDYDTNSLSITFPRGMFKSDDFVYTATEFFNKRMVAIDEDGELSQNKRRRHYVKHIFGTAGKPMGKYQSGNDMRPPSSANDTRACMHHRPIGWSFDELGVEQETTRSPLDRLALGAEAVELVDEAKFWKANEAWYRQRQIPWRRGWLLHGPPGTGKTALIRAVAEELDLPVFIYDLASMYNEELQGAWSRMMSEVPCMAVIEDIDAVFDGRVNVVGKEQQSLTFDCLLNCLDGIQKCDGLFVAITTNRLERIDSALGCPGVNDEISSRPGRIDRTLMLGTLDENSRIKIAGRILHDRIDLQDRAVFEGEGDTAAQFQERCSRYALSTLWASAKENQLRNDPAHHHVRIPSMKNGSAIDAFPISPK